jgi:hypothetical protein
MRISGYVEMMKNVMNTPVSKHAQSASQQRCDNGVFINENLKDGATFIHYNGSYHSDNFEGISWYLKKYNPTINYYHFDRGSKRIFPN